MTWKALVRGNPAEQVKAAHDSTIAMMGSDVIVEAAIRTRTPGQGYLSKDRIMFDPMRVYVYWEGAEKSGRGTNGDDNTLLDNNGTWNASFLKEDGDVLWPDGNADAQSVYEFKHPVYGRMRIDRVTQMNIKGQNVGYQVGLVRIS